MNAIYHLKKERPDLFNKLNLLNRKSSWYNFYFLCLDYSLIALSIYLSVLSDSIIVYLVALFVIGSRMRALDNLLHEASHGAFFQNRNLNNILGMLLCAFPIGSSMHAYRKSHTTHHSSLGDAEKDPDYIRYKKIGVDKLPFEKNKLIRRYLRVVFLRDTLEYLKNTFSSFIYVKGTPTFEIGLRIAFFLTVGLTVGYFGWTHYFLLFWIVPFLTTLQIIRFFAEISEHGGLYDEKDELQMTRNNLINPIARFFIYPHGDAYHMTHHLVPAVPHYHLGFAHQILMNWEPYAKAHHCFGYFNTGLTDLPSTFSEMIVKK